MKPLAFLLSVVALCFLACKGEAFHIDPSEQALVLIEAHTPPDNMTAEQTMKILRIHGNPRGYPYTITSADVGKKEFVILHGFEDFKEARTYVDYLKKSNVPMDAFAIPATQYTACMKQKSFEEYRAYFRTLQQ